MISGKSVKYIYFLWGSVIFLNLFFKAGWDLWMQTLSFYLTIAAFIPTLLIGLNLKIKLTGFLFLAFSFSLLSYLYAAHTAIVDITFTGWINYLLFFALGTGYLSTVKEKAARFTAAVCVWAAALDLFYPLVLNTSLFPNPNIKAGFFILTAPFLLYKIKETFEVNKHKSIIWMIGGGAVCYSFITASSRWGSLVMGVSIIVWLLFNNMKKTAAAAAAVTVGAAVLVDFHSLFPAAAARREWITAGIRMISRQPVTGFGPASTPHILPYFTTGVEAGHFTHYIHSYFIQFAAEFGLPAAVFLIVFLLLSVKRIFLSGNILDKTAAASLFFLMAYNLFEYNLSIPLVGLLFFSILGTFFPGEKLRLKPSKKIAGIFYVIVSFILITGGAVFATRPFLANRHFSRGIYKVSISELEEASVFFEKSLEIYPECELPLLGLASIEIIEGNLLQAEELIRRSIPFMEDANPAAKVFKSAKKDRIAGDYERASNKYMESILIRFTQFGYLFSFPG